MRLSAEQFFLNFTIGIFFGGLHQTIIITYVQRCNITVERYNYKSVSGKSFTYYYDMQKKDCFSACIFEKNWCIEKKNRSNKRKIGGKWKNERKEK